MRALNDSDPVADGAPGAGNLDSLIDGAILASERRIDNRDEFSLDRFLADSNPWRAVAMWTEPGHHGRREVLDRLNSAVAALDTRLNDQLNAILHHPSFQKLEASWRGLQFLLERAAESPEVEVRVLSLSWPELVRDLDRAIEFDQSQFFKKVYSEEFDTPGGKPFGAILADYQFSHRISPDLDAIESLSHVAAAAFAPLVMSADPALFGLDDFGSLSAPLNLPSVFEQTEYLKWRRFRESEDARFVGLVLPNVLMRAPYAEADARPEEFRFIEQLAGPDSSRYLWGSAVYALGAVLVREFGESGWLASIHGVERGIDSGGLVTGLAQHSFGTDAEGVAAKYSTDVLLTDRHEKMFSDLGFMPLCHCKDTAWSAFYGSASTQKPKSYDRLPASVNARLSSMLQYMFCVSRFAHYLKVIGRDCVGRLATAEEIERDLQRWLLRYTIDDDDATSQAKAKAPLREGRVEIRERPGKPGHYSCVMQLRPHFQLDQVATAVKLVTEIRPDR